MLPKILYANARSAVNKLELISCTADVKAIDCIAIAETWFNGNHSSAMTDLKNYTCFRDDRAGRIGGGVAIWAKHSLNPLLHPVKHKPAFLETVAIRIIGCIYILCVYIPPDVSIQFKEDVLNFLISCIDDILFSDPTSEVILCGDFNRFPVQNLCNVCNLKNIYKGCLLYTSPSPRDGLLSRMPSSA